ncbi:putative phospholipase B-like 2 [Dermacentor silvarum]|uniref:putative phospholipase B-like 2 n=1 Tax=Dermacentor silvarum TaxID=543639 RepID=UPI0021008C2E|nr:putative phospholipase B-like 2 [Dermacentor silvarum]
MRAVAARQCGRADELRDQLAQARLAGSTVLQPAASSGPADLTYAAVARGGLRPAFPPRPGAAAAQAAMLPDAARAVAVGPQQRWAYLEVESSPNVPDEVQAYAAGALEAYLTSSLMEAQWKNMFAHYCDNQTEFCSKLYDFLQKNLEYSSRNEKRLRAVDPYWNMVYLQMRQLLGLSDAFEQVPLDTSREITNVTRALFFSLVGDFLDLEPALRRTSDLSSLNQVPACSALVKVVGDNEDLYVAHNAWFLYKSMLRIQKKYTFPWHYAPDTMGQSDIIPGHTITMSSYAGKLVSLDDFYLTSAGLVRGNDVLP